MCPGRSLMIGLRGRSAEVVDAIEVVCDNDQHGRRIGGEGGREAERLCPPGWLAVGITGRHGAYVESVSVMCAEAANEAPRLRKIDAGEAPPPGTEAPIRLRGRQYRDRDRDAPATPEPIREAPETPEPPDAPEEP
jgi:hypothetical protein